MIFVFVVSIWILNVIDKYYVVYIVGINRVLGDVNIIIGEKLSGVGREW